MLKTVNNVTKVDHLLAGLGLWGLRVYLSVCIYRVYLSGVYIPGYASLVGIAQVMPPWWV